MSAGEELRTDQAPYGWQTSKDVGTRFTDGLNLITVTPQARGPLRLISATPIMDDEGRAVRVIGVRARVNPDMLPPGSDVGSFQEAPGFPPALPTRLVPCLSRVSLLKHRSRARIAGSRSRLVTKLSRRVAPHVEA